MADSGSNTPRIVFYKYPKVNNSIRNITNEIDNRLKEINKINKALKNICPSPKKFNSPFEDRQVLHLMLSKNRGKNKSSTKKTDSWNNSFASYHLTEPFKSRSHSKKSPQYLHRNRTSLFKNVKNKNYFKRKYPPCDVTDNTQTTDQHLKKQSSIKLPKAFQINDIPVRLARPYSSICVHQRKLVQLCNETIEESSKLHQNILNNNIYSSKELKRRVFSHSKTKLNKFQHEIPFDKVNEKYYIYHLGHFIPKNKGIKDNLIGFQTISKISPSESYNMRNILGEEFGCTVDTNENEILFIARNKEREQYLKPGWINIADKKARIRFRQMLRKTETNKRELTQVMEKYNLTTSNK